MTVGQAVSPSSSPCCVLPTALASHDYILKIVPTVYEDKSGKQRYSYQYTVANKVRWAGRASPAVCNRALCWPRVEVPAGCVRTLCPSS